MGIRWGGCDTIPPPRLRAGERRGKAEDDDKKTGGSGPAGTEEGIVDNQDSSPFLGPHSRECDGSVWITDGYRRHRFEGSVRATVQLFFFFFVASCGAVQGAGGAHLRFKSTAPHPWSWGE